MVDSELLEVLTSLKNKMVSKDDLASLKNEMASKDDLISLKNEMASKDDLISLKNEVKARFNAVDEHLNFLQHTCTLMQYEHGQKLGLIFDYIKEYLEKHEQSQHHLNSVDTKLMDHSIRISILESSGVYKSALEQMKQENSGNANK